MANSTERPKVSEVEVSQEFAATISKEAGKSPAVRVKSRVFYEHQLKKFKHGEDVTLIITNRWPKRTNQQNKFLWSVVYPMVAAETGESDIERLHTLFKAMFLTTGTHVVLGRKIRMTKSTTELSVAEFCDYVRKICAEVNCIPPPSENYNLAKI